MLLLPLFPTGPVGVVTAHHSSSANGVTACGRHTADTAKGTTRYWVVLSDHTPTIMATDTTLRVTTNEWSLAGSDVCVCVCQVQY